MGEDRNASFLIPWAGGLMAGWGDLSPLGIGWSFLVLIVAIVLHGRVTDYEPPANGNGK